MSIGTPYLIGSNSAAAGSKTIVIAVGHAVAALDAIVVGGGSDIATNTLPTGVTDSQGNTYALAESYTPSGASYVFVSIGSVALATTDTITITYSGTGQVKNVVAIGCSGVASAAAFDQVNATSGTFNGTTGAPSVATPLQLGTNDLAVGLITSANAGGVPTWGGGWTAQATAHTTSDTYTSLATQVLTGSAAVTASATIAGTSSAWTALVITLSSTSIPANFGSVGGTIGICGTLAGAVQVSGAVHATIDFSASVNQGISVINTWTSTGLSNYGLMPVKVNNTTGHGLLAVVAWNGAEVNPVSNLADDAHNWWVHLGTSSVGGNCRCSIWLAPNAQKASIVSVGLSWFAQGVVAQVFEMPGLPNWANIDFSVSGFNNSTSSFSLSGTATQPDIVFACVADANNSVAVARPGGWNSLGRLTVNDPGGAGGPADTGVSTLWKLSGSGSVNPVWTTSTAIPLSGVLVGISQSPTAPVQKNTHWPSVHVEMALGYNPGDPTRMPVWTDMTSRLIGGSGDTSIQSQRGRQYESAGPEAGDLTLTLRNDDGALTPGNTASPYYPNIRLGTPVRAWGAWNNRIYAIGSGYTERDPQTWPLPQYGQAPWEAPDSLSALSNSVLPSALAGEILADTPYIYVPCGDTYLQNQATGQSLSNLSRTNQRPMTCQDALFVNANGTQNARYLQTGLSWQVTTTGQVQNFLGLAGDNSSAIGVQNTQDQTKALAVTPQAGAWYQAPDFPQASPSAGVAVEFWALIDPTFKDTTNFAELLRISGPPNNYYQSANRSSRFLVRCSPTSLYITMSDFYGNTSSLSYAQALTDGNPHHFAFVITVNAGGTAYTIQPYVDGKPLNSFSTSGVQIGLDWNYLGVGGVVHNDGGISWAYNYTIGHVAYFGSALTASRIQAHYNTAKTGSSGDDTVTRMAKLLTWGGFGGARAAAPPSPSPVLGPADQIAGQSLADAANTLSTTDGGMFFCDAANNATWWPRSFLYNRPVKWILGDNPANGEIPYDPGEEYDYDNTFLSNSISATRQINSSSNGATAVAADLTSQQEYFTRTSAQGATLETTSDQDAFDKVNWQLQKYKQPALRVQQVVLNPAANTSVWPAALGIEQGDIVQVIRRPLGGAVVSGLFVVQMVSHAGGPDTWRTTVNMVPYLIESNVLTCDAGSYSVVGNNGIGW